MQLSVSDRARRIVKARQLFHEGCEIPSQLVSDVIVRSWFRSQRSGLGTADKIIFNPVSTTEKRRVEEANRELLSYAEPEMQRLCGALTSSNWIVACIDKQGCVIKPLGETNPACRDIAPGLRPGVNLSEQVTGTTGPSCALTEGRPSVVNGNEHFLEEAQIFSCSSVPLFDPQGQIIGALNASRRYDGRPVGIPEVLMVASRAIENRMVTGIGDAYCFSLHYRPELMGTPMSAILAFSEEGRLLGANQFARQLLGIEDARSDEFSALFGTSFASTFDALRRAQGTPVTIKSASGIRLYASLDAASQGTQQSVYATQRPSKAADPMQVVFDDPSLAQQLSMAQRAFAHDVPILINGDTGTGKEILARLLHTSGPRCNGPFIAVNCSAIPAGLIEAEFFGYENGAFTGARRGGMIGKFEQAHGGTLFLDEIGDMPVELQARLLRVLQEHQLTRIGGSKTIALNFSLICATHRDLAELMAQRTFREDLYFRVKGMRVELPPLRRRTDIDALIDQVLRVESGARPVPHLSARAREALRQYAWPGNIRELSHVLRLGVALAEDREIDLPQLPAELTKSLVECREVVDDMLERAEREAIRTALIANDGNITATARALGIARATLYRKQKQFGLAHQKTDS